MNTAKSSLRFQLIMSGLMLVGVTMFVLSKNFAIPSTSSGNPTSFEAVLGTQVEQANEPEVVMVEGKPISLRIPSLDIDLPVVDGNYDANSKTWNLSKDKAHYALITPQVNNTEGNTFIYGHNRKEVFAKLPKVTADAQLEIDTENGLTFTYAFVSSVETTPYDDSLFKYKGAPIVTLQTCSGLWYQNRQLFTFKLVSVNQENGNVF